MLSQALILTSLRDYASRLKQALLNVSDQKAVVLVEQDALRAVQVNARNYDLIIVDHIWDSVDGLHLVHLLKGLAPDVKYVVVSDISESLFSEQAFACGTDLIFLRPRRAEEYQEIAEELYDLVSFGANSDLKKGTVSPIKRSPSGTLHVLRRDTVPIIIPEHVIKEAPPLAVEPEPVLKGPSEPKFPTGKVKTDLPNLDSHWKISLTGELLEGAQMTAPERCAFITFFFYRKLADIAVALEVDYFSHMTLYGPHLQQVVVADNWGVHHGVFETAWTTESQREQFVKWSCEQSL